MIEGYKYYLADTPHPGRTVPVDHDPASFAETMHYDTEMILRSEADLQAHFGERWQRELNRTYTALLDPDRLVVGIGSGYGEHEFLLHRCGYRVIASDIVPGLGKAFSRLDPSFRFIRIDAFRDDYAERMKQNQIDVDAFDILITGLLFYFDDAKAHDLLVRIHDNLGLNSHLVLTLRYRDGLIPRFADAMAGFETKIMAAVRRRGIVRKHHGYRRSAKDIEILTNKAGFRTVSKTQAMFGYEMTRSFLLGQPHLVKAACKIDQRLPLFHSAVVFDLIKG